LEGEGPSAKGHNPTFSRFDRADEYVIDDEAWFVSDATICVVRSCDRAS